MGCSPLIPRYSAIFASSHHSFSWFIKIALACVGNEHRGLFSRFRFCQPMGAHLQSCNQVRACPLRKKRILFPSSMFHSTIYKLFGALVVTHDSFFSIPFLWIHKYQLGSSWFF